MLTFVVSHQSELVSFLAATCLQLYYGRNVRIFVVNILSTSRVQTAVTPWCGVSMVSSLRGSHWELMKSKILYGILLSCLVPLDNIRLTKSPENRTLNPEFALGSQKSTILARISGFGTHSGLFYHPHILIQKLKLHFAHSSNVFLTSVASEAAIPSMIRNLQGSVVWVNFISTQNTPSILNHDMPIQSKLSSFEPISVGSDSWNVPVLPRTVLWIPLLRALLGTRSEPSSQCQIRDHGSAKMIDIYTVVENPIADQINQSYDLLYCLRMCGYMLDRVGEISTLSAML